MVKATLVVSKAYQKNRIFDMNNPVNGRDNHLYIFKVLKNVFYDRGIDLSTQDINCINDSEIVIYNDMPNQFYKKKKWQKIYLFALESIAVLPRNFNISLYSNFDKVFTWYDDLVDEIKVIKINYSFLINPLEFVDFEKKSNFICMVCGNKYSNHIFELYSERYRLVNFFEKNTNIPFSLYGTHWDNCYNNKWYSIVRLLHKYLITTYIFKVFERILFFLGLKKFFLIEIKNYKGILSPKIPKLKDYKFNICYENTKNINGYITEKIFDCFLAGCVPVYLGAPNINSCIPNTTFIDRRNFRTDNDLMLYLQTINKNEYLNYQKSIKSFLKSESVIKFTSNFTAKKIVNHILS